MIQFKSNLNLETEVNPLIIGIFSDFSHQDIFQLDHLLNNKLLDSLNEGIISTKFKTVTPFYPLDKLKVKKIYFIGLGKSSEFTSEKCKEAIGKITKSITSNSTLLLETFQSPTTSIHELATLCAEGVTLATYKFDCYKTEHDHSEPVTFSIYSKTDVTNDLTRGVIYAEATNDARQLFNQPNNKLTATDLANHITKFSHDHQLEVQVLEKEEMKQLGMGGILGVNQGSTEPPKLIVAKYEGNPQLDEVTALVGKGITFDTGGYCLKPRASMDGMKGDMGGAASAFGAFQVAVRLKLPVNLLLVIPATDNVISAQAMKPGDILTTMNGKTVEVTNTDAEGRLVLADALTFAKQLGATKIIDLATLTGAIIVALGSDVTGAFTNDQAFLDEFQKAANQTDEYIWQMPLHPRDQKSIRNSDVADLNNAPLGKPGAIMAAAFLKEFVGDTPWIHLDIAGTAEAKAAYDLGPKGGTGVMVRTIAKYLESQH